MRYAPMLTGSVRVVYAVTHPRTARGFLLPHLRYLVRNTGWQVTVVCSPGPELVEFAGERGIRVIPVLMSRRIAPLCDLAALWKIFKVVRVTRPQIVHAATPKAGLLGTLAAWLQRVPHRVYALRGLRFETARGLQRLILRLAEATTCQTATIVLCVSDSLRKRVLEERLVSADRVRVLARGSLNGVDATRFSPTAGNLAQAAALREQLDLPGEAPVLGFVGRLTRDKGIPELVSAWSLLRRTIPSLRLLLVGDYEDGDPVPASVRMAIEDDPRVIRTGFVRDPAPYYHLMNVLALPTHREGFPNVPLEAAAAGVPVVATRATGVVDAVIDGVTGLLVPVGDVDALAAAIKRLLEDRELAARLAEAARERVLREFQPERIWDEMIELYRSLLEQSRRTGRGRRSRAKRAVDLSLAAAGLVLAAPLMLVTAAAVRITMGKPVLFRQTRAGLWGRPFTLYKFRTMTEEKDAEGKLLPDEKRLTRLGRLLRRFSFDELPQLWNVLKGEMSLVGPRPLPVQYVPLYNEFQRRRLEVKPGVTGWAQVNGRNALSWEQKFELDVRYVDHQSLWLDLKILAMTAWQVLRGRGISQPGHATMPEFAPRATAGDREAG